MFTMYSVCEKIKTAIYRKNRIYVLLYNTHFLPLGRKKEKAFELFIGKKTNTGPR